MTRHLYDVPDWGVGEIWVRDGIVVQHELASEELRPAAPAAGGVLAVTDQWSESASNGNSGDVRPALASPMTTPPGGGAGLPAGTVPGRLGRKRAEIVSDLCRRIEAHLAGVTTTYEGVVVDLEWATPLQRELALAARAIPWGEVVSYGELAVLAGRHGAARAAGSFCADNRYSLIVPCHRVVAANGIGGYGAAGVALKRRLLAVEGVHL